MFALPAALMFFALGGVGALAVGQRWCRAFWGGWGFGRLPLWAGAQPARGARCT